MKKVIYPLVLSSSLFCLGLLNACSSSSKKPIKEAPSPGYESYSSGTFTLRPVKEVRLENGLKIIFIHDATLPRVSLTMLVKAGVLQDPRGFEGLNALSAYLLEQGTQTQSASKLADSFGNLGTELSISPGSDFTLIFSDALSSSATQLLGLFTDVVMNPAFTEPEILRLKSQVLASLQKKIDNPSGYADEEFDSLLFGKHAYAFDSNGTPETVRKIKKQNIIRHYLTYFRPNNSSLAVVGNFDENYEEQVKAAFGKWTKKNIPVAQQEPVPEVGALNIRLLTKKGLQQTQIRLGQIGIKRNDPDFLKLRVANEILGGGFASRLNQKVRDDLGLTYSISSSFDSRFDSGSFDISTFTKNETVEKTLSETLNVVSQFVEGGITEKELAASKNQLIGQFPRAIETADKTAFNLLALDFYGIPMSYLTDYNKNIMAISLKDVNEVIKKHISPKNYQVLIYGDPKIAAQLKEYKFEKKEVK